MPWYPRSRIEYELGIYGASLVDLAFELQVGTYSEPQLADDTMTYIILNVTAHETVREIEPVLLGELIDEAYYDWLEGRISEVVEFVPYDPSIVPTRP